MKLMQIINESSFTLQSRMKYDNEIIFYLDSVLCNNINNSVWLQSPTETDSTIHSLETHIFWATFGYFNLTETQAYHYRQAHIFITVDYHKKMFILEDLKEFLCTLTCKILVRLSFCHDPVSNINDWLRFLFHKKIRFTVRGQIKTN